jgi:hypothetical protein
VTVDRLIGYRFKLLLKNDSSFDYCAVFIVMKESVPSDSDRIWR